MNITITNDQRLGISCLLGVVVAGFFLMVCSPLLPAKTATVNPVIQWIPVVSEFQIAKTYTSVGLLPPPFSRVKSKYPNIPSAWETLKPMVRIRLRGSFWAEDEPIVSGWRPWADELGVSGLEVRRSDQRPGVCAPIFHVERGTDIPIHWKIDIWTEYRLPKYPESELLPDQSEYQELIKQKIEVRDFSLTVHKLEGGFGLKNIRKDALPEPSETVCQWRDHGHQTLAFYEAQDYRFSARSDYVGEVRLKMKLYFPELDDQKDTQYETPIEVSLRFLCGSKVSIRVISDQLKHWPGGKP